MYQLPIYTYKKGNIPGLDPRPGQRSKNESSSSLQNNPQIKKSAKVGFFFDIESVSEVCFHTASLHFTAVKCKNGSNVVYVDIF